MHSSEVMILKWNRVASRLQYLSRSAALTCCHPSEPQADSLQPAARKITTVKHSLSIDVGYTLHTHIPTHTHTQLHTPPHGHIQLHTPTHTHNYTHTHPIHTATHTPTQTHTTTHTHQHIHTTTHSVLLQRLFSSPAFWTFCYFMSMWTDSEAEAPILWTPDANGQLTGKDPAAGKDWRQKEKEVAEDEMVGWHHWLNGHEFQQTQEDSEGQGSLACCSSWGCKELDTT